MICFTEQELSGVVDMKDVMRTKALLTAHDILLEEQSKLSKAIVKKFDISEFVLKESIVKFPRAIQVASNVEVSSFDSVLITYISHHYKYISTLWAPKPLSY